MNKFEKRAKIMIFRQFIFIMGGEFLFAALTGVVHRFSYADFQFTD